MAVLEAPRALAARTTTSHRTAYALAAVAVLVVLVRARFFAWPLIADEATYAYTAHWWSRGLTVYTDDLWFDKPQAILVVYQLGTWIFGETTEAIRLWGALWAAGTVAAVWLVGRHLVDNRAALVAALLCGLFSALPRIEGFTANAETFMVLPATLSAYFVYRRQPVAAGLAAGLAVGLKPSGASAALLAGAWMLYDRRPLDDWLKFALAGAVLPLLMLLHGALTIGAADYVDAVLLQRVDTPRPDPWSTAFAFTMYTLPVWAPLVGLGLLGLRRLPRRPALFVGAWLLSAALGVAMGGNWWPHYGIQLIAPLSVAAAPGLLRLWDAGRLPQWLGATALIALPVAVAFPTVTAPALQGNWDIYQRPGYVIASDVAGYIAANTSEDARIYVAFGDPGIYHLAGRRSAAEYPYYLLVETYPESLDRVIDQMERREVAYVLWLHSTPAGADPDRRFEAALAEHYVLDREFRIQDYIDPGEHVPAKYLEPIGLYRARD